MYNSRIQIDFFKEKNFNKFMISMRVNETTNFNIKILFETRRN